MKNILFYTFIVVLICYIYVSYVYDNINRLKGEYYQNLENFSNFENNNSNFKKKKLVNNLNTDFDYKHDGNFENNIKLVNYYDDINDDFILKSDQFVQNGSQDYHTLYNIIKNTYLKYMNDVNIYARKQPNINALMIKYEKFGKNITEDEIIFFNNHLKTMYDKKLNLTLKKFLDVLLPGIKIVKGNTWLENGMPHTHANYIIFNANMFKLFSYNTFIHELTHVHQRLIPQNYYQLYEMWGFYYYDLKNIKGFEEVIKRNRHNPDGLDCNWILRNSCDNKDYWIGAVYNSTVPNSLQDVNLEAYTLINQNNVIIYNGQTPQLITQFDDFKKLFCVSSNHYHPNEIVAQYMEYYYYNKKLNCKNYNIFVKWFEKLEF